MSVKRRGTRWPTVAFHNVCSLMITIICEGSRELRPPKAPIRVVSMEKRRMKWMEHSYPYASNHREAQEIGNAPETT